MKSAKQKMLIERKSLDKFISLQKLYNFPYIVIKGSISSYESFTVSWKVSQKATEQKMKFFIKDFFSRCDQIRSFLMENFIFCAVALVPPKKGLAGKIIGVIIILSLTNLIKNLPKLCENRCFRKCIPLTFVAYYCTVLWL